MPRKKTADKNLPVWTFHPDHAELIAETHARPAQQIRAPAEIVHLAFACSDEVSNRLFNRLANGETTSGARHVSNMFDGVRVRLEKHTEFLSCTLFQETPEEHKKGDLLEFLKSNFPVSQTEIYVLLKLRLFSSVREMLKSLPVGKRIYGGKMRDGIDVRSTFAPDEEEVIHFALYGKNLTPDELGRRIQRLMEMETYRTMSLLGLPVARRVGIELSACENELERLTVSLRNNSKKQNDEALFTQISDLSERTNILRAETRYRFAASRAYFDLFQQRVQSLEEEKVGDVQTMSGFLRSRSEPAMATIESTEKRQQTLTDDLSRALVLLRTRIELNLNKGNQALLKSMDKRHDQQLKISQTVEGLSVIAITYYAVGLLSYPLKALAKADWMPLSEGLLTAGSVPFVLALVWMILRRVRRAWEERIPG